jgi:hypothetical protein
MNMEDVKTCLVCGLPRILLCGEYRVEGKTFCTNCIKKHGDKILYDYKIENETIEAIMSNNEQHFELVEKEKPFDLSFNELRSKILKPPYKPIETNGIPVYKNLDPEVIIIDKIKEEFKYYKNTNIEVSSLGRVRLDGEILRQHNIYASYLFINFPSTVVKYFPYINESVYRLVAETWKAEHDKEYNIVHHISNNGYDNRTNNLLWVNEWQHTIIHPEIKLNLNKYDKESLFEILRYYKHVNFTSRDFDHIYLIAKRIKTLSKDDIEKSSIIKDIDFIIENINELKERANGT